MSSVYHLNEQTKRWKKVKTKLFLSVISKLTEHKALPSLQLKYSFTSSYFCFYLFSWIFIFHVKCLQTFHELSNFFLAIFLPLKSNNLISCDLTIFFHQQKSTGNNAIYVCLVLFHFYFVSLKVFFTALHQTKVQSH